MSRAKIAHAAARSDAVRVCSLGAPATSEDLGASTAAAASTATAAQQLATRAATGGCSAFASLAAANPGPLSRAPFVSRCTPARWVAGKMDRHWRVPIGSGGAVAAATDLQPSCNREIVVNQCVTAPVARLQQNASRHVRARVCVGTRAYTRGQNPATLQPFTYPIEIEGIYGCRTVANRLRLQPAMHRDVQTHGNPPISNKIGGGKSAHAHAGPSDLPIRGQIGGRGAKTFRLAIAARPVEQLGGGSVGRVGAADLDQAQRLSRNGGFLRVSAGRSGHVGTAMLEQAGERRGNVWFVEPRRKLCRLTSGGAGRVLVGAAGADRRDAAAGGGAPPCAARQIPSSLADAIFLISIGDRTACHAGPVNGRQVGGSETGPGDRAFRALRHAAAGRGVNADWGLRRSGQPSGGSAHVN